MGEGVTQDEPLEFHTSHSELNPSPQLWLPMLFPRCSVPSNSSLELVCLVLLKGYGDAGTAGVPWAWGGPGGTRWVTAPPLLVPEAKGAADPEASRHGLHQVGFWEEGDRDVGIRCVPGWSGSSLWHVLVWKSRCWCRDWDRLCFWEVGATIS